MLIVPVRHHSPASAAAVERLIEARRPRVVLVEGPSDANALIPLLVAGDTRPPVAIYAYRQGDPSSAVYVPFCDYSPELVALRAAARLGAESAFCDVPSLAHGPLAVAALAEVEREAEQEGDETVPEPPFEVALTRATGHDSFEAWWETLIEQEAGRAGPAVLVEALTLFGDEARSASPREGTNGPREAYMAAVARGYVDRGVASEEIVLVCGAAHAGRIAAALRAGAVLPKLPEHPAAESAMISYSFPRLSEQSGYGAGNRAPRFYQRVWEMGGDYEAATRESLVILAGRLRAAGRAASLAQCIDAANLAANLAIIREKRAPGVDEIEDAAAACLGGGQIASVREALDTALIGETVGVVTAQAGQTPLQQEFYATLNRFRMAALDAPRQVLLHLDDAAEAERAVFLHRLEQAEVPFAREIESGIGNQRQAAGGSTLDRLARVREKWELQWSPATDTALIERGVEGASLVEVVGRRLQARLRAVEAVDAAADLLLQMALCDLTALMDGGLTRLETLAADSLAVPALVRAAARLDGLLRYGSVRRLPEQRLTAAGAAMLVRVCAQTPAAAHCADDAAEELSTALLTLHNLVQAGSTLVADAEPYWSMLAALAEGAEVHSALRGLALALLTAGGRLSAAELGRRLGYHLSLAENGNDCAALIGGLFRSGRGGLVRNPAVIGAVTDFLLDLELDALIALLPPLRRTFGSLSAGERAYLAETLERLLGLAGGAGARLLRLTDEQTALLRVADAEVAATLAGWRDRYGIG